MKFRKDTNPGIREKEGMVVKNFFTRQQILPFRSFGIDPIFGKITPPFFQPKVNRDPAGLGGLSCIHPGSHLNVKYRVHKIMRAVGIIPNEMIA